MTLTELLLVVVLLLGFTVLGLWFSTTRDNYHQLNEGVGQLISLLNYSKAIAQQTGKVVVVQFPQAAAGDLAESTAATNDVTVLVELPSAETMAAEINSNIKVVQLTDETTTISFYPDGSFDSVSIIVYSLNDDDQRRAVINLNGINGTIKQQP